MTPPARRRGAVLLWLLGLAAVLAASWAIWRFAPIGDADLRLAACLALPTLWAVASILAGPRVRLPRGLADSAALRAERRAALALLKEYRLGGRRSRYALPLYLVVGPPGFGKTTLLERSGLGLTAPMEIGDTRWWIGDEAILVEATLPGTEPERLAALLRGVRPRLAVNGIVLVASPGDLALADREERREQADRLAQDLHRLEEALRLKPPTYLLLSKIDLTPGFLEVFDRMEAQERAQPWGFALADRPRALTRAEMEAAATAGFGRLLETVRQRELEWMSREIDPVRCGRIQGFGAQLATLRPLVQPLLHALSPEVRRVWPGPAVRAVFLTSAQQEALTIDALLPDMSDRFAMPRSGMLPPDLAQDEEALGYFIAGAFRAHVFPEAGLLLRERSRPWVTGARWTALAALALAWIGLGAWGLRAIAQESLWPPRVTATAADIGPALADARATALPATTAAIARLEAQQDQLAAALVARDPVPPGLDAAAPLHATVAGLRRQALRNALAPHLAARLAGDLVRDDLALPELQLRLARAEGPVAGLADWLQQTAQTLPAPARPGFLRQGAAALDEVAVLPVDPRYLDAGRRRIAYLESLPSEQRP